MHVDAIEQRPGQAMPITRDLIGLAAAAPLGIAEIAAGAGIHGGNQLEGGRKLRLSRSPRDRDPAAFQGLAQGLEHIASEFAEFVEKQNAAMGERCFTRARHRPAAHQRGARNSVMRRPEGAYAPVARPKAGARQRQNGCRLERLQVGHRWQQAWQSLRKHGLAGAGRPDEQQTVAACGRDFECTPGAGLPPDLSEVRGCTEAQRRWSRSGGGRGQGHALDQGLPNFTQGMCGARAGVACHRCLGRTGGRQDQESSGRVAAHGQCQNERPPDRPQFTGERKLAHQFDSLEYFRRDACAGAQDADRDRQIESPRPFRQIGRRKIDRDPPVGKFEAFLQQCCAHPFTAFANLGVRQADDVKRRQAVGEMHFNRDRRCLDTDQTAAANDRQRHGCPGERGGEQCGRGFAGA